MVKSSVSYVEVGLTLVVLAVTTAIATKQFTLSNQVTSSPVTSVGLVVVALGLFSVYPAVGVSLLLLTAVLMFNRNVRTTIKRGGTPLQNDNFQNVAGLGKRVSDDVFQGQMNGPPVPDLRVANAAPANEASSKIMFANRPPIPLPSNPPIKPPASRGTYGADSIMKEQVGDAVGAAENGFMSTPRPLNEFKETDPNNPMLGAVKITEGFQAAPFGAEQGEVPYGSYPIDSQRATSTGEVRGYIYRPEMDTGSNEFKRFGPNLDEKSDSFKYYTN